MHYWIVKSEPDAYSFDRLMQEGKTMWDGVRSYQARNNLRAMKVGDQVLFYHSVTDKALVGIAEVAKEAYPDPTAESGDWSVVDLIPVRPLLRTISLGEIKTMEALKDIALVRQGRLSVIPLTKAQFGLLCSLENTKGQ
ncbi:EVE domain-containing protein [Candidatus Gracilibacteria bacterium CG17_big_fil_post_rev_8_21_14_2_50_48_13]|nr:MAG: EVE domain-containing protein [Candidatus Gracilibacteria bacterium CG17_big_fil_post_rev_8_21_14_2_50_48_13]